MTSPFSVLNTQFSFASKKNYQQYHTTYGKVKVPLVPVCARLYCTKLFMFINIVCQECTKTSSKSTYVFLVILRTMVADLYFICLNEF